MATTVTLGKLTVTLTAEPYCDNYGTDGEVRYYAHAVDDQGNEYRVAWEVTDEWADGQELYDRAMSLTDQHRDLTEEEEAEIEAYDLVSAIVEDESNACDWDNPVEIIPQ